MTASETEKKRKYGLPEIGGANVAATLARRRDQQPPPKEEEEAAAPPTPTAETTPLTTQPALQPTESPPLPPAEIETPAAVGVPKDLPPAVIRQGVDFRRDHLDLITEMIYRCHRQRIKLQGKKGPSLIVRAALDELAAIYTTEPARFDSIMRRYSGAPRKTKSTSGE
jgi:hypothetical protein